LVLVSGAAVAILVTNRGSVDVPAEGPWTIAVAAGFQDLEGCLDDESISDIISSADLPSTSTTLTLTETADRSDAERVASCLAAKVGSRSVTVIGAER
jgi:hypothetical protein